MFRFQRALYLAASVGLMAHTNANASLLAYEGFDYTSGGVLAGQNGGVGFGVNTWIYVNSGSPYGPTTVGSNSETYSLNPDNAATATGESAYTKSNDRRGRMLDTTSRGAFGLNGYLDANGNIGADGKTLYLSFTQRSANNLPDSFFEFELKRNDLGDGGRVMGIGDDVSGNNMNLRTGSLANQSLGARNLSTNLYVVKIDFLPGNDRVTVYRNPVGTSAPASPTISVTNADVSFDGLSMGAFIGNQGVYTDEIRLGTTYSDVINGTATGVQHPSKPDQWRPGFHFSPAQGWLNDPNGLIYDNGVYNMYYQSTPDNVNGGPKSWGHATSTDLVHWTQQPQAIAYDGVKEAYSGSTVIDYNNSAGFGAGAMLAFYTGASINDNGDQNQLMAYSLDGGKTFTRYGEIIAAPKQSNGADIPTRDPSVHWDSHSNSWVMALSRNSGGSGSRPNGIEFYKSTDAKNWSYQSTYGSGGWECPDLFDAPLTNDLSTTKSILMVGANGGTDYHVGAFDGSKFNVEQIIHADYGPDFYAAQQYNNIPDSQGRNIVTAWMANPGYAGSVPAQTWRGQMTVPRTVSLKQVNGKYVLTQNPVAEIDAMRVPIAAPSFTSITPGTDPLEGSDVSGDMLDLVTEIKPGSSSEFGVKVHVGPGQETVIGYDVAAHQLYLDRTHSSSYTSIPLGKYTAPLDLQADGSILLRILVDRSSVEVFANGGLITMTALSFAESYSNAVSLFALNGTATVDRFEAYSLAGVPEPAAVGWMGGLLLASRRRRCR